MANKLRSKEIEINSTIYNEDGIYIIIQRDYILEAFIETYGILSSCQGRDYDILRQSKYCIALWLSQAKTMYITIKVNI